MRLSQQPDVWRANLLKIWAVVVIFTPLIANAALTLNIEGTSSYTFYTRTGTVLQSSTGRFLLATDSSRWRLHYYNDDDKIVQQSTFDGEYIYTVYANVPIDNFLGETNVTKGENGKYYLDGNTAIVDNFRQSIPLCHSARIVWMGLLTCGWIADVPSQLIPPWLERASPEAFSYRTHIYREGSNCCSRLDFITSQTLWTASKEAAKKAISANVPPEDFIEGRFQVISHTNSQDKCIPLETEFVRFFFPIAPERTRQSVRSVIRTKASRYYFSSEAISRPKPSVKTYVNDIRFESAETPGLTVPYILTSQTWIDKNDPRLSRVIEQSKSNYFETKTLLRATERPRSQALERRRLITFVLVLLALAGPVLIFLLSRNRAGTKRNK